MGVDGASPEKPWPIGMTQSGIRSSTTVTVELLWRLNNDVPTGIPGGSPGTNVGSAGEPRLGHRVWYSSCS